MRLFLRPRADRDIDHAALFLLATSTADVACRFLGAIQAACDTLRQYPRIGTPVDTFSSRLRGVRVWPVPGFRSTLSFYVDADTTIEIVRVLHGARDLERILGRRRPGTHETADPTGIPRGAPSDDQEVTRKRRKRRRSNQPCSRRGRRLLLRDRPRVRVAFAVDLCRARRATSIARRAHSTRRASWSSTLGTTSQ